MQQFRDYDVPLREPVCLSDAYFLYQDRIDMSLYRYRRRKRYTGWTAHGYDMAHLMSKDLYLNIPMYVFPTVCILYRSDDDTFLCRHSCHERYTVERYRLQYEKCLMSGLYWEWRGHGEANYASTFTTCRIPWTDIYPYINLSTVAQPLHIVSDRTMVFSLHMPIS